MLKTKPNKQKQKQPNVTYADPSSKKSDVKYICIFLGNRGNFNMAQISDVIKKLLLILPSGKIMVLQLCKKIFSTY